MTTYDKFYIDGAWVAPAGTDTLEVIDSATEAVFATIPAGTPDDIDRAVAAAKAAFPAWSEISAPERGKLLLRVAEELEARRDEIADVMTHEVGMPKPLSAAIQVGTGISAFRNASELASTYAVRGRLRGPDRARSRSASSAASRRGTTRSTRSGPRSRTRSRPAAPSC